MSKGHAIPSIVLLASVLGLGVPIMLAGCKDRTVEVSLDAAIKMRDLAVGSGPAAEEGNLVDVHYVGTLPDGSVLIDTHTSGKSHKFIVGDGTVIPGMDMVVRGMRAGGVRVVSLPPHTAYGRMGYGGVVPADTTITFKVEMLRVSRTGASPVAWSNGPGN